MLRMKWFIDNYVPHDKKVKVLDVGSYDVNGSYKKLFEGTCVNYVGLDMEMGPNVDYVPADPYRWEEIEDNSIDYVISGNAFEHIEYPWLTIKEIYRVLRAGGIACILAPNSINEHRYPTDCYRYYSDGFSALAKWAGFQIISVSVGGVPSDDVSEEWFCEGINDTLMVVGKDISNEELCDYPKLDIEKRYYQSQEWERRYHYLRHLITDENPINTYRQYFKAHGIKKIVLYGFGDVGKIAYSYLKEISEVEISLMDKKGGKFEGTEVLLPQTVISEDSCIMCALLIGGIKTELQKIYPMTKILFVDDVYCEESHK